MAKFQVIVNLDTDVTEASERMIQMILQDALYEFSRHRQPARKYVEQRYIEMPEKWREEKIRTTDQRVRLADELHHAVFDAAYAKLEGPWSTADLEVRRQEGSKRWGIYNKNTNLLIEGGFFDPQAANDVIKDYVQNEVEQAERKAGWDPNP